MNEISHSKKNLLMVIDSGHEWLGIQWVKVTLYFHLQEKIAKRLHHGLLDTILVNTLTNVREFKNIDSEHSQHFSPFLSFSWQIIH